MAEVFPPRNLPGRAEEWGRSVEGWITSLEKSTTQTSQKQGNWGRGSAGRLAVLSRNIDEVSNRSSEALQLPDMSVTGSATVEPFPRTETTVSFPAGSGNRAGVLTLSGNVSESAVTFARLYTYLIVGWSVVGVSQVQPSFFGSAPVEWQNDSPAHIIGTVPLSDGQPLPVTIRIVRGADPFTPGTSTMTLSGITLTLTRTGLR